MALITYREDDISEGTTFNRVQRKWLRVYAISTHGGQHSKIEQKPLSSENRKQHNKKTQKKRLQIYAIKASRGRLKTKRPAPSAVKDQKLGQEIRRKRERKKHSNRLVGDQTHLLPLLDLFCGIFLSTLLSQPGTTFSRFFITIWSNC